MHATISRTGTACTVCGSRDSSALYRGLIRCAKCGFTWADVELSTAALKDLYSQRYFLGGEYSDYLAEERIFKRTFARLVRELQRYAPSGKLLEVGCAYGFFLDVARRVYDVHGLDLNADAVAHVRNNLKMDARCEDFVATSFSANDFDVLVCLATLEHLQRPDLVFETVARLLKPGGVFFLSTVDMDSLFARLSGSHWRFIYPPSHISYFSRHTLRLLLHRFGFTILKERTYPSSRGLGPILAQLTKDSALSWLPTLAQRLRIAQIPVHFNLGDHRLIIARKMGASRASTTFPPRFEESEPQGKTDTLPEHRPPETSASATVARHGSQTR